MHVYILYGLLLAITIGNIRCEQWYQVNNPHFLDVSNVFPAIKEAGSIKIIKFFSPWCKYCRYVKSYMDTFKSTNQVSSNFKFFDFNCQSNGPMFCWEHFQVRAYPAVVMFDQNGNQAGRFDGLYPQQTINNILNDFNNKAKAIMTPKVEQHKVEERKVEETKKSEQQIKQPGKQEEKASPPAQASSQDRSGLQKVEPQIAEVLTKNQEVKKPQINRSQTKQNQKSTAQPNKQKQQQLSKIPVPQAQKPKEQHIEAKSTLPPIPQQAKSEARNMQGGQNDQKVKPNTNQAIKVSKQMVDQASVEATLKPNPSKPELQKNIVDATPIQSSPSFFKYLLYLIGASVGALYAIKIFTTRLESPSSKPKQPAVNNSQQSNKTPKITSQDMQNQILAEQIADQHL